MRTEKELLQLILDNIDMLKTGLCNLTLRLVMIGKMSYDEKIIINDYILNNAPNEHIFWFELGYAPPRIEWLKQQIEKV